MNIKPLTEAEFMGTFSEPMRNVTGEKSEPIIDIWLYAEKVFAQELPESSVDDADVNYVYLSGDGKYHHVGIWYGEPNVYLVVVVNLREATIYGHRILNLSEEYGLA
ncbi:MAG: hypothetical protein M3362_01635 [Acidobacteriota bacterium]|nr:hypothetical protein [Acidobacteriota bacterium]